MQHQRFNLVIEILMVDQADDSFNLVIEILMVGCCRYTAPTVEYFHRKFQSRNRDSYG